MGLLGKIVYVSNHGTSQGIIPRFFLHFEEMLNISFGNDKDRERVYLDYYTKNLNEFTNFHDSYHNILALRKEYIDGIVTGIYYKSFENGEFTANKSPEIKIKKAIQDFFKDGKPLLTNFAKSKLLDDDNFILSKLLVVPPKAYKMAKDQMLPNLKLKGYMILFNLIEDAQEGFKRTFFKIRDDFEHNGLQIPDFTIKEENGVIKILDPELEGQNVFKLIDTFYHKTFDLIEDLTAYFCGLNTCHNTNGFMTLFLNNGEINPAKFKYRYVITMNTNDPDLIKLVGD